MKNIQQWIRGSKGLKLNVLANLGGFLIIFVALEFSTWGVDLYNVAWHDAAYGIHLALLLFGVIASSTISLALRSELRQNRKSG